MSTEPRQRPGVSRRQFLATAPAWGLAAGCSRSLPAFTGGIVGADATLGHRFRDGGFAPANREERVRVLVVGGGISGLVAARGLLRGGVSDLAVLEIEAEAGGNSRGGANAVSAYPWGAHYVPLPGPEAIEAAELFREFGVIIGTDSRGRPIYRDEYLCHDPMERLFLHGRWQDGIIPSHGLTAAERGDLDRFLRFTDGLKQARGADGRPLFAIPVDRSSADPAWRELDQLTMGAWLDREGYRSEPLRWYVDYCCRDDFGAGIRRVSAWAGLHYFAARGGVAANAPGHAVVTWPEGNAWLVKRLRAPLGDRLRSRNAVWKVEPQGDRVHVECWDAAIGEGTRYVAEAVVLAVPRFVAARMMPAAAVGQGGPQYYPWMVANLTLDRLPVGRGAPLAWDNVIYRSNSLGYVVATHQHLHSVPRETVLTYYLPLDHLPPAQARQEAQGRSYGDWCELVLDDLGRVHPELRSALRQLDVMVWGHGMVTPVPDFVWGPTRAAMARPLGRVHFAHTDVGGISIFEEACAQGSRAAAAVLDQIGSLA
jgi:glycine/D-amino acid oxidase-like deaminating enzyme